MCDTLAMSHLGLFMRTHLRKPMVFAMSPGPQRPQIRDLVQSCGGVVVDPKQRDDSGDRIRLGDPEDRVIDTREDVYSFKYVLDCCKSNALLPGLASYRINKVSNFEPYDPCDILLGYVTWDSIQRKENEGEVVSDFDDDDGQEEQQGGGNVDGSRLGTDLKQLKSGRQPYTKKDQEDILRYIIRKKLYEKLKGISMWKEMARDKDFRGGRTHQSLKENFRRQIMPRINSYNLEARHVSLIKRAWDGERVNDFGDDGDDVAQRDQEASNERAASTSQSSSKSSSPRKSASSSGRVPEVPDEIGAAVPTTVEEEESASGEDRQPEAIGRRSRPKRRLFNNRAPKVPVPFESSSSDEEVTTTVAAASGRGKKARTEASRRCSKRIAKRREQLDTTGEDDDEEGDGQEDEGGEMEVDAAANVRSDIGGEEEEHYPLTRPQRPESPKPSTSRRVAAPRSFSFSSNSSTGSNTRQLYSEREDNKLARYIKEHRCFHEHKGRSMWEEVEKAKILPGRTWQSMKNRFLKNILPRLGSDHFENEDDDDRAVIVPRSPNPNRRGYNKKEDLAILGFIVKNRRYTETNGNSVWKLMEEQDVVDGRSWQSMKERFRKTIRQNLDMYGLDDNIKRRLKNG